MFAFRKRKRKRLKERHASPVPRFDGPSSGLLSWARPDSVVGDGGHRDRHSQVSAHPHRVTIRWALCFFRWAPHARGWRWGWRWARACKGQLGREAGGESSSRGAWTSNKQQATINNNQQQQWTCACACACGRRAAAGSRQQVGSRQKAVGGRQ